jgi:uncharacterized protein YacL (UPF0231 family)
MDYQFFRDEGSTPVASCEIAAFGDWLSHDIGNDKAKVAELIAIVDSLLRAEKKHVEFVSKDYRLQLNQDEVEIAALFVGFADEDALPEGTEFEDPMLEGCGLDDLQHLLLAWQEFIQE